MKKVFSALLSLIIMLLPLAFSTTATAASTAETVTVTVTGTQNNAVVKEAIDTANALAASEGIEGVTADKELTAIAKKCAIGTMLFTNEALDLPTGEPLSSRLPELGSSCKAAFIKIDNSEYETVAAGITTLSEALQMEKVSSVGISVFTCGNTTVLYMILSTIPAGQTETNFNTTILTTKEKVLVSNLQSGIIDFEHIQNGKYTLSMRVAGSGLSDDYFNVIPGDVAYRSSNAKIFKIKGTSGYVKKDGRVVITSYSKSGNTLIQGELPCDTNASRPVITALKSKKKGRMAVKWTKNNTNASGYQLQYSTNKKFKKVKTINITGRKNISKTLKKLKSGKKYYVRVRAYVDQGEGEKLFTPWSKRKAVTIK